jgi:hypothetical protein
MPAKSEKQERFMQAVANNPKFAKKVGVPTSVGKEFTKSGGGMANTSRMNRLEELGRVNAEKAKTPKGKSNLMAEKKRIVGELSGGSMAGMKKGGMATKKMASGGMTSMGAVKTAAPSRDGVAVKGKTKGKMVTMAGSTGMKKGGMTKMKSGGRTC